MLCRPRQHPLSHCRTHWTLETITGVSSVSYWNANLSEFANAELAPPLNVTDGNKVQHRGWTGHSQR